MQIFKIKSNNIKYERERSIKYQPRPLSATNSWFEMSQREVILPIEEDLYHNLTSEHEASGELRNGTAGEINSDHKSPVVSRKRSRQVYSTSHKQNFRQSRYDSSLVKVISQVSYKSESDSDEEISDEMLKEYLKPFFIKKLRKNENKVRSFTQDMANILQKGLFDFSQSLTQDAVETNFKSLIEVMDSPAAEQKQETGFLVAIKTKLRILSFLQNKLSENGDNIHRIQNKILQVTEEVEAHKDREEMFREFHECEEDFIRAVHKREIENLKRKTQMHLRYFN